MSPVEVQGVGRRGERLGWGVAFAAILVTGAVIATSTPAVGRDAAMGLLASDQLLSGRTTSLVDTAFADPADLTRDTLVRISWWPPGQQYAAHGFRLVGLSLGGAMHALTAAGWAIGLPGWCLWFAVALREHRRWLPWLIAALALLHMTHIGAFVHFGGDTLVWAFFPWIALLNVAAATPRRGAARALAMAGCGGALAGGLVVAKYTVVFLVVGLGAAWLYSWRRGDVRLSRGAAWTAGAAAGLATAWFGGLSQALAGRTPADAWCVHPATTVIAWAMGGPLMAISDSHEAMNRFISPLGSLYDIRVALVAAGSFTLAALWLGANRAAVRATVAAATPAQRMGLRIAVACCVTVSLGLAVLLWRSGCISWEGRHQQYGALLLLPFGVATAIAALGSSSTSGAARALTIGALVAFLGSGVAYGAGAFVKKAATFVLVKHRVVSSNGVRLDDSSRVGGTIALERDLRALPDVDRAVIYTFLWDLPLVLPDLRYVRTDIPGRHRGRPAGGVVSINLPEQAVGEDGLRRTFPDVPAWTRVTLPSAPFLEVWIGR